MLGCWNEMRLWGKGYKKMMLIVEVVDEEVNLPFLIISAIRYVGCVLITDTGDPYWLWIF